MTRKFSLLFLLSLFFILQNAFCETQQSSASVANRRTAIRYLQLAKQNISDKNWSEAESLSEIGLAYDDSIADLWYLNAAAKMNRGDKKSEILPLVKKSLDGSREWVDYNMDGARVLYADILCSTRDFDTAVSILDEAPLLYSADAEFIRAKALYNKRTAADIESARLKIDAARKVYPKDERFPELFYNFEFALQNEKKSENQVDESKIDNLTQKIADSFLASLSKYTTAQPDLELLASYFVQNHERRIRLVKAFNARGEKSVLYPAFALELGLIDERAALDYFYEFSDKNISLDVLRQFIKSIKDEENKKELSEYLNSYRGTLLIDTDGDLVANMTVTYERGRPAEILYDENEDDDNDWTSRCDFGVPLNLSLENPNLKIKYGNWPFIEQVTYALAHNEPENLNDNLDPEKVTFNLIADALSWCPFSVEAETTAKENLDIDFFVPALIDSRSLDLSGEKLLNAALSYTVPSKERKNASIKVTLLNGFAQQAEYSADGKIYAVATFESGIPSRRLVDMNGDGIFETVEEYGFSDDSISNFISENDEVQIITNLFGEPASGTGIYLKSIKIDKNGDTIPDFMEEYTADGGKISSWDSNSDGEWDVRFKKNPEADGKIHEQATFYEPIEKHIVEINSENGIPVNVKSGDKNYIVSKGVQENFYWLSDNENDQLGEKSSYEEKIIEIINQESSQGVCIIVEVGQQRFLAVRIEDNIFAEGLPSPLVENDEKK